MKVALFYNKENVGDVLIMKSNDEVATSFKKFNDLRQFDEQFEKKNN